MRRRDVLKAIQDAGMFAKFDAATAEYRVTFPSSVMPNAAKREASAYYTSDAIDAIATARAMRARYDAKVSAS